MDVCKGLPHDPNQGFVKPCPIRDKCLRFRNYNGKRGDAMQGPYDFDDKECGQYKE